MNSDSELSFPSDDDYDSNDEDISKIFGAESDTEGIGQSCLSCRRIVSK